MDWKRREAQNGNGNKNYVKLQDGEHIVGVFRGDHQELYKIWENSKYRYVTPDTTGATWAFRRNFVTKENGALVAKIFEQGTVVWNNLCDIADEYDLSKTFLKITRHGEKQTTTYSIIPQTKIKMTKELEQQIAAVPLLDLGQRKEVADTAVNEFGEEIPF